MKLLAICRVIFALAVAVTTASGQITTSQYDNQRTGAMLTETVLNPQNVNAKQFGKLGAFKVDGAVFAQPLLIPALEIPGKGKHNVIFIATEHDSVYAFDADRPNEGPLWQVNFLDSKRRCIDSSRSRCSMPFALRLRRHPYRSATLYLGAEQPA